MDYFMIQITVNTTKITDFEILKNGFCEKKR